MVMEAPTRNPESVVDERKVAKCVSALVDDHYRQGGNLTADDFQRAVDRRRLSADEILEVYRRLEDEHGIVVRQEQSDRRRPRNRRPAAEDALSQYLAEIGRYRLLTAEEELQLARRMRAGEAAASRSADDQSDAVAALIADGLEAKDQMILANLRLVVTYAVKYQRASKLELLDLIQEGVFGLTRAVEKFDRTKGYKFSTYAVWWIRQSIQRAVANKGRTIRIPVHAFDEVRRVARTRTRLANELGRTPTPREVADHLDLEPEHVQFLFDVERDAISLDQPLRAGEDATLADTVDAGFGSDPCDHAIQASLEDYVAELLSPLSPRERQVIEMRFGIGNSGDHTLEEVGEIMGVTRERVRQIQKKLIDDVLPRAATARGLHDYY